MNDIELMAYMFVGLILLYGFGYVFIMIRNNCIAKKRDNYQQLLLHACATRKQYIKTLEILDNSRRRLDSQHEELRTEKLRLQRTRAGLREISAEIRTRQSAENIDKLEANVIEQKKLLFTEHWKILNNFRTRYNNNLQAFRTTKEEHGKHTALAANCSRDWEEEKGALLSLYNELKDVTHLADPRMMLSTSN